jgi:hypothetical protein
MLSVTYKPFMLTVIKPNVVMLNVTSRCTNVTLSITTLSIRLLNVTAECRYAKWHST